MLKKSCNQVCRVVRWGYWRFQRPVTGSNLGNGKGNGQKGVRKLFFKELAALFLDIIITMKNKSLARICTIILMISIVVLIGIPDCYAKEKTSGRLNKLIHQLATSDDPSLRKDAALHLMNIKDARAVGPLIAALKDSDGDVRNAAVSALGEIKDARAIEPLIALMKHGDFYDNGHAKAALKEIGPRTTGPLLACLKDDDESVRADAADILSYTKDIRAVEPMIAALKDENGSVRYHAAYYLGEVREERAVEPLIALLNDKFSLAQEHSVKALKKIGPKAVRPLIAALKHLHETVRENATEVLIGIGSPAVEPLMAALTDKDYNVRSHAIRALGKIKDRRAVDPLIVLLNGEDIGDRIGAAEALGEIRDARAVEPLLTTLMSENDYLRESSGYALGKIKDTRAIRPLIALLETGDKDAGRALGEIGAAAVPSLRELLKSESSSVRMEAVRAIGKIDSPEAFALLATALKDENLEVIAGAYSFYIRHGFPGSEALLIKALDRYGTTSMAEDFLNCGNGELEVAGKDWATKHGYGIQSAFNHIGPVWDRH